MKQFLLIMSFMTVSLFASAQSGTVTGTVTDADGEALIGATVVVQGTTRGSITDFNGQFSLFAPAGDIVLVISYVGFTEQQVSVSVSDGGTADVGSLSLEESAVGLNEVLVLASVGIDRKTPVAMSNVKAAQIDAKIGSQEFPEILKATPGVYATKSGGGFGDGRINIRGFNDENVAVLINGIPVNDMENGNVYWSNWAGLTDATRQIQVQRGLGASKVAVPSIGGTINIISKASDRKQGGHAYVGTGNDAYSKVGFMVNTGLSDNGWAITLSGSKTQGDGYVDGTEFLGHAYFANISKKINDQHELTFTAVGAKQRHGQRVGRRLLSDYEAAPSGIKFNADAATRDGKDVSYEDNFYHKPQLSLNHYWTISSDTELSTAVYASTGTGGGGGTSGNWNVGPNNTRVRKGGAYGKVDLNVLVDINEANPSGESLAFMRASRNDHNWYGVLTSLTHKLSDNMTLLAGLDVRSYTGKHFYEVTDLLGGEYSLNNDDINNPNRQLKVGDKFNYNYDGQVGWQGAFAQVEYSQDKLAVFGTLSVSNTSYQQVERYNTLGDPNSKSKKVSFLGLQVKGGANYNLNDNHNVYANVGFFSKAPFYSAVFLSRTSNNTNDDAENEKILSTEVGYGYKNANLNVSVNIYRTEWRDRSLTRSFTDPVTSVQYFANILGVNAVHQGVEIEGLYNVTRNLKLTGMFSVGDWQWANNVENVIVQNEDGDAIGSPINVFSNGLKVGDAAQTTAALGLTYTIIPGLSFGADLNYQDNLFASFDPTARQEIEDNVDAWEVPSASTVDLNMTYDFDITDLKASIYANVYNVGDVQYIQDANDGPLNNAETATVYYAFGINWNIGLKVRF